MSRKLFSFLSALVALILAFGGNAPAAAQEAGPKVITPPESSTSQAATQDGEECAPPFEAFEFDTGDGFVTIAWNYYEDPIQYDWWIQMPEGFVIEMQVPPQINVVAWYNKYAEDPELSLAYTGEFFTATTAYAWCMEPPPPPALRSTPSFSP